MRIIVAMLLFASALVGGRAGLAQAAQPAVQGCFGASVSADAKRGADAGRDTAALAQANTGVGAIVQQIQGGNVPDSVFPNTCNG